MTKRMALAMLGLPAVAHGQAYRCTAPATIPAVHAELPTTDEPVRRLPIGGYTLAISWAPEYCHAHGAAASAHFECRTRNRFGFTLHGLWPDGVGRVWPQYCAATPLLTPAEIGPHLCATPSAQLLQHEWAKHGTCMLGLTPDRYFARSNGLYARLRYPDMAALARRPPTAATLASAVAAANPGIGADMMRITTTAGGWLDEIWFCLDTRFRFARCKADGGGVDPRTQIRIAAPAR